MPMLTNSPGGFLHYFTEDWSGSEKFAGTGWANTEFRSYTFSSHEPSEAHLIETPESRMRRAGDAKPLDHNEQTQLKQTATKEWERNGYVSPPQTSAAKGAEGGLDQSGDCSKAGP